MWSMTYPEQRPWCGRSRGRIGMLELDVRGGAPLDAAPAVALAANTLHRALAPAIGPGAATVWLVLERKE